MRSRDPSLGQLLSGEGEGEEHRGKLPDRGEKAYLGR